MVSNRMDGLGNTPQMCTPAPATPAIFKCNNKNLLVLGFSMFFLSVYEDYGTGLPESTACADSFSFMHNGCTYWQLVYLNVSQEAALHMCVCAIVCIVMCVRLSLLRKVPFKHKYRHCLRAN